jgi:hypothetical protein
VTTQDSLRIARGTFTRPRLSRWAVTTLAIEPAYLLALFRPTRDSIENERTGLPISVATFRGPLSSRLDRFLNDSEKWIPHGIDYDTAVRARRLVVFPKPIVKLTDVPLPNMPVTFRATESDLSHDQCLSSLQEIR